MNTFERTTPYTAHNTALPKDQQKLLDRMMNIWEETTKQVAEDRELSRALSMSDNELMQFFYEKQLERSTQITERELRRVRNLNDGTRKFTERLKELGGTQKSGAVAKRLETTRQTVNNRLKANKLLAVKPGSEYLFPVFQFSGNQIVAGFEDVLAWLGEDLSPVTKVSFFTGMYFFGEDGPNVIDALKSENADEYMDEIKRQASKFGRHIA